MESSNCTVFCVVPEYSITTFNKNIIKKALISHSDNPKKVKNEHNCKVLHTELNRLDAEGKERENKQSF